MSDMYEERNGPYFVDEGSVYFRFQGKLLKVCALNDEMALLYEHNADRDFILLKHGIRERTSAYKHALAAAKEAAFGSEGGLGELVLVTFYATAESVEELNACIHTSGYVRGVEQRLAPYLKEDDVAYQIT